MSSQVRCVPCFVRTLQAWTEPGQRLPRPMRPRASVPRRQHPVVPVPTRSAATPPAGDVFSVNDAFTSKLYKVKIGMVAAQVGGGGVGGGERVGGRRGERVGGRRWGGGVAHAVLPPIVLE